MKLIRGIITACAVVTVSSAVAISASAAATGTLTATYDRTAGTVTISDIASYLSGVSDQCSYLVLSSDDTTVAAGSIKQIDQVDKANITTAIPVGTLTDNTTYYVRVGGASGGYAAGSFNTGTSTADRGAIDAERIGPYTGSNGAGDIAYAWYVDVTADGSYNYVNWQITDTLNGTVTKMKLPQPQSVTNASGGGKVRYSLDLGYYGTGTTPNNPTAKAKFTATNN